jgi:hypothetical protein
MVVSNVDELLAAYQASRLVSFRPQPTSMTRELGAAERFVNSKRPFTGPQAALAYGRKPE